MPKPGLCPRSEAADTLISVWIQLETNLDGQLVLLRRRGYHIRMQVIQSTTSLRTPKSVVFHHDVILYDTDLMVGALTIANKQRLQESNARKTLHPRRHLRLPLHHGPKWLWSQSMAKPFQCGLSGEGCRKRVA